MTAPNVIWVTEMPSNSRLGACHIYKLTGATRYICDDAPELMALVDAAKDALTVLEEYHMGLSSPLICDLVAALAAWEAIAPKPAADALTPSGIQSDGSGLDPATLPIHRGGQTDFDDYRSSGLPPCCTCGSYAATRGEATLPDGRWVCSAHCRKEAMK